MTVLANWDIDEGRKRSVAVAGCRRSAAVFVLTPAGEEIAPKGEPAVERPVRPAESGSMLPASTSVWTDVLTALRRCRLSSCFQFADGLWTGSRDQWGDGKG